MRRIVLAAAITILFLGGCTSSRLNGEDGTRFRFLPFPTLDVTVVNNTTACFIIERGGVWKNGGNALIHPGGIARYTAERYVFSRGMRRVLLVVRATDCEGAFIGSASKRFTLPRRGHDQRIWVPRIKKVKVLN